MARKYFNPETRVRIPPTKEKEENDLFPIPCEMAEKRIARFLSGTQFKTGALYVLLFHITNKEIIHASTCPALKEKDLAKKIGEKIP